VPVGRETIGAVEESGKTGRETICADGQRTHLCVEESGRACTSAIIINHFLDQLTTPAVSPPLRRAEDTHSEVIPDFVQSVRA